MWSRQDKSFVMIVWLICSMFLFTLGLWTIDVSASANNVEPYLKDGVEARTQSLVFGSIEPYITYHAGMVIVVSVMLINTVIITDVIIRNKSSIAD